MGNDDISTPNWLKELFIGYFDPCPLNPDFDGLIIDWQDWNFVNPPYSNPYPWVLKAIEENKKGKYVVMLLRIDPSTKWHRALIEHGSHFFYCNERIFKGSNFPNMLVIL